MESLTFFGVRVEYFGVFRKLLDNSRSFHVGDTLEFSVGISIASSEKQHFSSLARKKSAGEHTIYDFFERFFQRSIGKIQSFLGKNLGSVASSFECLE